MYQIKPFFHMSGKSPAIGDFTFSRPSQILPIYRIIARRLSQILPIMNLAGKGKCAKNRVLNKKVTAFIQQHWCTRAYAASFSLHLCSCSRQCKVFRLWESRSQLKTPYHSSLPLGQEIRDSNHSCFRETPCLLSVIGIGKERNPSPTSPNVQIWAFICRQWWPTIAEIWDGRENRNAPDSPDLTPSIPDDRGYLRFLVFISRQNLGQSGNSKIYDSLEFSRHLKTSERSKRRSSALNKVDESFLWLKNYWAYSLVREFLLSLSLFCFYITSSDILLQINNSIKMR